MSNFQCEKCGTICYDTPRGYITGCEHYPADLPHCWCGNTELGFTCMCEYMLANEGDTFFTCEFCGLYKASKPNCNKCEEDFEDGVLPRHTEI
jgi:hypothetical protein